MVQGWEKPHYHGRSQGLEQAGRVHGEEQGDPSSKVCALLRAKHNLQQPAPHQTIQPGEAELNWKIHHRGGKQVLSARTAPASVARWAPHGMESTGEQGSCWEKKALPGGHKPNHVASSHLEGGFPRHWQPSLSPFPSSF